MHFGSALDSSVSPASRSTFSSASTPSFLGPAFHSAGCMLAYRKKSALHKLQQRSYNRAFPLTATYSLGGAASNREERQCSQAAALQDRVKSLQARMRERAFHNNVMQTPSLQVPVKLLRRLAYTILLRFLSVVALALRIFSKFNDAINTADEDEKNKGIAGSSGAIQSTAHAAADDSANEDASEISASSPPSVSLSSGDQTQTPETVYLASVSMEELRAAQYGGLLASQQGSM
jgi:hypothetical protein